MLCQEFDHEEVVIRRDPASGLTAIFALHSTALGAAAGGCRRWTYATVAAAADDALRLSEGMTYKNALAGIPFGGGKSVILSDGRPLRTRQLHRFAQWLNELHGRYITAEDVGMGVHEMRELATKTVYVSGLGREGLGGDPSPKTAYGVYVGLKQAVELRLGTADLQGVRVGVLGLGNVGMRLCHWLARAGAELHVADIDDDRGREAVTKYRATAHAPEELTTLEMDVFAPCALGGAIDEACARTIDTKVVAGAANNQLASAAAGRILQERGVLYAPDFVINAGGVISIAHEYLFGRGCFDGAHDSERWIASRVDGIGERLRSIVDEAAARGLPTHDVAVERARAIVEDPEAHFERLAA